MQSEETERQLEEAMNNPAMPPEMRTLLETVKTTVAKTTEKAKALPRVDDYEAIERRRSLVIVGMAESNEQKPSAHQNSDLKAVQSLMDELDVEAKPVTVYRMGPRENDDGTKRTRLLKVVMPASVHARLALKNSKNLKNVDGYKKVFVRPSLTREERVEQAAYRCCSRQIYIQRALSQPTRPEYLHCD